MICCLLVKILHDSPLCGLTAAEAHVTGDDLNFGAVVAVLVLVRGRLQAAFDSNHAALLEILTDELGGLPPRDDVDKIGLALFALPGKAAVNRDAEAAHIDAARGGLQFRFVDQTAHQRNNIKHGSHPLPRRRQRLPRSRCWRPSGPPDTRRGQSKRRRGT